MPHLEPQDVYAHLDSLQLAYRRVTHAETRTSEESARARGEPLEIGAKALLLKVDEEWVLAVLSAARRLDSRGLRAALRARSLRFVEPAELLEHTGLVPGSVPPFGHPLLPFDLLVDEGIAVLGRVAFNAASLTESVVMGSADYLAAARPRECLALSLPAQPRPTLR